MFLAGEHLVFTGGKNYLDELKAIPQYCTVHPHCASSLCITCD